MNSSSAACSSRTAALKAKAAAEYFILIEVQVQALEKAKADKEAEGEIETEHPSYLGAQDTYYVCTIVWTGEMGNRCSDT